MEVEEEDEEDDEDKVEGDGVEEEGDEVEEGDDDRFFSSCANAATMPRATVARSATRP